MIICWKSLGQNSTFKILSVDSVEGLTRRLQNAQII